MSRSHRRARSAVAAALATAAVTCTLPAFAGTPGAAGALGTRSALADTTDQIVLTLRRGHAADALAPVVATEAARFGVQVLGVRRSGGTAVVKLDRRLPNADADRLAQAVRRAAPEVRQAAADRWVTVQQAAPNDPLYGNQWHYFEPTGGINLRPAWNRSTGRGVVVAVIDTGYRPHADLAANLVPGYDMIVEPAVSNDGDGRDADAIDPGDGCGFQSTWHGTHVAGTIAAATNNNLGVSGVAPRARVQPVRALGCGGGYTTDIDAAITWASGGSVAGVPANPTPARVINMSLGGFGACPATTQVAISGAVARGTVVVAAAGNWGIDMASFFPANCVGVVAVAATNRAGARAWYSNFGPGVALAAPGGDTSFATADGVLSTLNAGYSTPGADSYAFYQGTSMATPHVAGVAALILSVRPGATPAQVRSRLQSTARAFPGVCSACGSGILDANKALTP